MSIAVIFLPLLQENIAIPPYVEQSFWVVLNEHEPMSVLKQEMLVTT